MPWVNVWLHFVWSTKDREPLLTDKVRSKIFIHIRENARKKNIYIDFINGYVDHVHCLVSLGTNQTLEEIMQLIKGESSFWINKNKLTKTRFAWQDEYFVSGVTNLEGARKYIANQEEHHKKVTFDEEFETFLIRAGFIRMKD
jgi:REP element-mobilizing transposase RayT